MPRSSSARTPRPKPQDARVRGRRRLLLIGFEFEYADTSDDLASLAPALKTGIGNVLLQTPFRSSASSRTSRPAPASIARRSTTAEHTGFGFNTGGGVKVTLVGPLRLRVDYRVFRLGSDALNSPAHRLYAGLNLKF